MTIPVAWEVTKLAFEAVTAVCTVGSAAAWIKSSTARIPVPPTDEPSVDDGWSPSMISGQDEKGCYDRFATIDEQSRLNSIAARWAAGASIGLAVITFIDIVVEHAY